jgi:hypothetical protein
MLTVVFKGEVQEIKKASYPALMFSQRNNPYCDLLSLTQM